MPTLERVEKWPCFQGGWEEPGVSKGGMRSRLEDAVGGDRVRNISARK